jgi:hypothetical protein
MIDNDAEERAKLDAVKNTIVNMDLVRTKEFKKQADAFKVFATRVNDADSMLQDLVGKRSITVSDCGKLMENIYDVLMKGGAIVNINKFISELIRDTFNYKRTDRFTK